MNQKAMHHHKVTLPKLPSFQQSNITGLHPASSVNLAFITVAELASWRIANRTWDLHSSLHIYYTL
jgi:hypothetical protein